MNVFHTPSDPTSCGTPTRTHVVFSANAAGDHKNNNNNNAYSIDIGNSQLISDDINSDGAAVRQNRAADTSDIATALRMPEDAVCAFRSESSNEVGIGPTSSCRFSPRRDNSAFGTSQEVNPAQKQHAEGGGGGGVLSRRLRGIQQYTTEDDDGVVGGVGVDPLHHSTQGHKQRLLLRDGAPPPTPTTMFVVASAVGSGGGSSYTATIGKRPQTNHSCGDPRKSVSILDNIASTTKKLEGGIHHPSKNKHNDTTITPQHQTEVGTHDHDGRPSTGDIYYHPSCCDRNPLTLTTTVLSLSSCILGVSLLLLVLLGSVLSQKSATDAALQLGAFNHQRSLDGVGSFVSDAKAALRPLAMMMMGAIEASPNDNNTATRTMLYTTVYPAFMSAPPPIAGLAAVNVGFQDDTWMGCARADTTTTDAAFAVSCGWSILTTDESSTTVSNATVDDFAMPLHLMASPSPVQTSSFEIFAPLYRPTNRSWFKVGGLLSGTTFEDTVRLAPTVHTSLTVREELQSLPYTTDTTATALTFTNESVLTVAAPLLTPNGSASVGVASIDVYVGRLGSSAYLGTPSSLKGDGGRVIVAVIDRVQGGAIIAIHDSQWTSSTSSAVTVLNEAMGNGELLRALVNAQPRTAHFAGESWILVSSSVALDGSSETETNAASWLVVTLTNPKGDEHYDEAISHRNVLAVVGAAVLVGSVFVSCVVLYAALRPLTGFVSRLTATQNTMRNVSEIVSEAADANNSSSSSAFLSTNNHEVRVLLNVLETLVVKIEQSKRFLPESVLAQLFPTDSSASDEDEDDEGDRDDDDEDDDHTAVIKSRSSHNNARKSTSTHRGGGGDDDEDDEGDIKSVSRSYNDSQARTQNAKTVTTARPLVRGSKFGHSAGGPTQMGLHRIDSTSQLGHSSSAVLGTLGDLLPPSSSPRRHVSIANSHSQNTSATTNNYSSIAACDDRNQKSRGGAKQQPNDKMHKNRFANNAVELLTPRNVSIVAFNLRDFHFSTHHADEGSLEQNYGRLVEAFQQTAKECKGTLDSFHGDRFYFTFNAVRPCHSHATMAATAALKMASHMASQSSHHSAIGSRISCGIATGQCLVGNLGSDRTKRHSVIGTAFTEATVLERLCKRYANTSILLSGETAVECELQIAFLYLDLLDTPGGRNQPIAAAKHAKASKNPSAHDEWMYELAEQEGLCEYQGANKAFKALLRGDVAAATRHLNAFGNTKYVEAVEVRSRIERFIAMGTVKPLDLGIYYNECVMHN